MLVASLVGRGAAVNRTFSSGDWSLGGLTRERLDDGVCRAPPRGRQRASPCVTSGRAGCTAHGQQGCGGLVCSGGAVQPWFTTTDDTPGCVGEDGADIPLLSIWRAWL